MKVRGNRSIGPLAKKAVRSAVATALATFLAAAFLACGGGGESEDTGLEFYQADFSSPEELKNWKCNDSGKWEIRDGALVADARIPQKRSILWLDRPLARNVQIEFEAECLDKPGDINCFINGNGKNYSGYEVIIAGWHNTKVGVYKSMEDGNDLARDRIERDQFEVQKGRLYAIKIKKDGGKIRVYVDDELLITAVDDEPIEDEEHRYFGLSTFENVVRFDNLTIKKRD